MTDTTPVMVYRTIMGVDVLLSWEKDDVAEVVALGIYVDVA